MSYLIDIPTGGTFTKYKSEKGTRIICDEAFKECYKLSEVIIPPTVNFIGDHAFLDCSALSTIDLPESLVYIGNGAFDFNGNNSRIILPSSIKLIDGNPFDHNCKIVSKSGKYVVIDNVLYSYDMNRLLSYCNQKDFFTIPSGVKVIGKDAFRDSNLKNIIFPNTIELIECNAFEGNKFSVLKLPTSLKKISKYAFSRCKIGCLDVSSLIEFLNKKEEVLKYHFCGIECELLKVPKNTVNYFKKLFSGSEINAIIDEDYVFENNLFFNVNKTELISSFAFEEEKDYYIPEGTVCVRDDALLGVCGWGGVIHLPKSLKHIPKNAFGASAENFDGDLFVPKGMVEKYNTIFPELRNQIFEEKVE
jgi:hypothetical protein